MQTLSAKLKGLYTSGNVHSGVPEGALLVADNVVIDRESIAEPRRGFNRLSAAFANAAHRALQLWFYQDKLFAHTSADQVQYWTGSAWTALSGTYTKPTNAIRVHTAEANQNLYLTTSSGIYKQDVYTATPMKAGAYKALDLQATIPGSPTAAWLATDKRVTYRGVWGIKDANGALVIGAPSGRETVRNTAGADRDVSVVSTIPSGVTTAWFFQLYRSAAVTDSTGDVENNDELQLVYETNPSSGDISAGYLTVIDIVPDALRGTLLYTASSQEGLAKGNEQPPLARDLAVYKNHLFYADIVSKHRYYLTLLSVGGTNGIVADDTLTIGGVVFTAKGSETIASGQFKAVTSGSAAQNIRDTAISLCRVINRYASSTVYAYYLSGSGELPGEILIEERSIGGASFPVISSRATCWNPRLPSSGTTESSTSDSYPNGLMWSKDGQPEAVPLPHFAQAGSKDKRILRIVALRDSLFIFKEDGIYKLTGDNANNFQIELFDNSTHLLAPESLAVLSSQIFCYTDQGVVVVSETGVSIVSEAIKTDLLQILGASSSGVESYCFGVAYDTDHKYILWTISTSGDTYATQAFVYSDITAAWTHWDLAKTCGIVSPVDGKLYLGEGASAYVNQERKTYEASDHADFAFSTTITNVSADNLTLTLGSLIDEVNVGDVIYQSATIFGIVESIDSVASTVVVTAPAEWTVAACDVLAAISTTVTWAPVTAGNPGALHQFHTAVIIFETDFVGDATLGFTSDLDQDEELQDLTGASLPNWGFAPWGDGPWGGEPGRITHETWVPRLKQCASQHTLTFRHAVGFSSWELAGLALHGHVASERIAR